MNSERTKYKLIRRILKYSQLYKPEDLALLSADKLLAIQEKSLIRLVLKAEFRSRHDRGYCPDYKK